MKPQHVQPRVYAENISFPLVHGSCQQLPRSIRSNIFPTIPTSQWTISEKGIVLGLFRRFLLSPEGQTIFPVVRLNFAFKQAKRSGRDGRASALASGLDWMVEAERVEMGKLPRNKKKKNVCFPRRNTELDCDRWLGRYTRVGKYYGDTRHVIESILGRGQFWNATGVSAESEWDEYKVY